MSELSQEQPVSPHSKPEEQAASSVEPADELTAIEDLFNLLERCQQAFVQELEQAGRTCAEQTARINTLEAQLAALTGERDAAAMDKAAAQQSATELQQQLTALAETLQQIQKVRDEHAARVKTLEGEVATLKAQREAADKEKATQVTSTAELTQQLKAQEECLRQAQQARDELAVNLKVLQNLLAQQAEELQCNQERLQTIPGLQRELQESRHQGVQLKGRLETLSVECERRYRMLQRCEDQDYAIRQLASRSADLEEQLEQCRRDMRRQKDAHSAQILALEGELNDARDEAELLLEQLHLVQEELEHYFLLSQGQGQEELSSLSVRSATRQEDAAEINSNRGHLLSVV